MELERDEFVVTYRPAEADEETVRAAAAKAGFPARIVDRGSHQAVRPPAPPPGATANPPFFAEALSRARRDRKPLVVDFTASWCQPCQRMIRETFADPRVAPLLKRCVFVTVDTDEHPELSRKFGVVGMPDVRLLDPEGREVRRLRDFQRPEDFARELEKLLGAAR